MNTDTKGFRKVEKKSISNEIIEQFAEMLRTGGLHPGDRIPSEHDLVELLDVGRSSVREALKALEILGVVVRTNSGTIISEEFPTNSFSKFLSAEILYRRLQVADVYQTRRVLEVELAVLALRHVTPDDIDFMRFRCLDMELLAADQVTEYAQIDREFHAHISALGGNEILTHMWEISYDLFIELRLSVPVSDEFLQVSNLRHRLLVDALEQADEDILRKTMRASLDLGETDIARELAQ